MLETSVRWGPLLKEGNQPLEPKLFDVPEVAAFQHEDTKSTEEHEDGIYLYFVFFVSSCLRVKTTIVSVEVEVSGGLAARGGSL